MADLKNIEDIKSLVDDVDSFFENPNFTPKKQNKFFFSEGTSYYKQLLEVSKVIKMLQTSIKAIYDNQNTLQEEYDALDVEGLLALKDRVTSLETKATDLISKVSSLESDNVSNKAQIETNKTDIATLDSEIDTAQADIENIKTDVKTNYLKDISITSTDIKATEISRVDGVKTIQMEVTSTTPVDLGSQLTYIKQQNANVVNEVGATTIEDNESDNSYAIKQENKVIENGNITTTSNTIAKFDKDNFTNVEGIITTKLDYEETTNKLTEQENNLKGIQEQVNTNTSDIATNKTSIEGIKSEVEQTIQTELTSVKADVATNKTNIESNTANIRDLITKDSELSSKIDTNTTNISTNASAIETNKTAIANNTGLITNTSDELSSLKNIVTGTLIPNGTDLNTITEVGNYYCGVDMNYVNTPSGQENKWCSLEVRQASNEDYVTQVWWSMDRETHTKGESYYRLVKVSDPSGTYKWVQMVSATDLKTINNESLLGGGNLNISGIQVDELWSTSTAMQSSTRVNFNINASNYNLFLICINEGDSIYNGYAWIYNNMEKGLSSNNLIGYYMLEQSNASNFNPCRIDINYMNDTFNILGIRFSYTYSRILYITKIFGFKF